MATREPSSTVIITSSHLVVAQPPVSVPHEAVGVDSHVAVVDLRADEGLGMTE
jgi:hypothetical protein